MGSNILLLFRRYLSHNVVDYRVLTKTTIGKLREGIVASSRVDGFALEGTPSPAWSLFNVAHHT